MFVKYTYYKKNEQLAEQILQEYEQKETEIEELPVEKEREEAPVESVNKDPMSASDYYAYLDKTTDRGNPTDNDDVGLPEDYDDSELMYSTATTTADLFIADIDSYVDSSFYNIVEPALYDYIVKIHPDAEHVICKLTTTEDNVFLVTFRDYADVQLYVIINPDTGEITLKELEDE